MEVDARYVDIVRKYWITDNLPSWTAIREPLTWQVFQHSMLLPNGKVRDVEYDDKKSDKTRVIYLGHFLNIWGHCITDNLKKLWFLKTPEGKEMLAKGYRLVCTLHKGGELSPNFRELLTNYLQIDAAKIQIVITETLFDEIVIPQNSLTDEHRYYIEFKETIDQIRALIPMTVGGSTKVYFSRSRWKNGRDYGEVLVENVFKKLGYVIYYPEELTLDEQLKILKNCASFAATEGSTSHNVMFCQDGVECIVIRKAQTLNGYQFSSMAMRNCKCVYVDAHLSLFNIFDNSYGPFFLYVNDNLVAMAKDRGCEIKKTFPRIIFLQYLMKCLWLSIRFRQRIIMIGDASFYKTRLCQDF